MRLGALFRRMGYVKRTALAAAVLTAVCGRSGARRDGDRGGREARPPGGRSRRCRPEPRSRCAAPGREPARPRVVGPRIDEAGAGARSTRALRSGAARASTSRSRSTGAGAPRTCARSAPSGACAARARAQLRYVLDVGRVAGAAAGALIPTPHAGGLPPARAQPPVLAAHAVPGRRRPGELHAAASSLYQYFAGEGLQLHPLSIFKKANHLHGFCERKEPTCDERGAAAHPRRDGPRWR